MAHFGSTLNDKYLNGKWVNEGGSNFGWYREQRCFERYPRGYYPSFVAFAENLGVNWLGFRLPFFKDTHVYLNEKWKVVPNFWLVAGTKRGYTHGTLEETI